MPFVTFTRDVEKGDLAKTSFAAGQTVFLSKDQAARWERRLAAQPATADEIARISPKRSSPTVTEFLQVHDRSVEDLRERIRLSDVEKIDPVLGADPVMGAVQDVAPTKEPNDEPEATEPDEDEATVSQEPDAFDAMSRAELFAFLRGKEIKISPATKDENLRAKARQVSMVAEH